MLTERIGHDMDDLLIAFKTPKAGNVRILSSVRAAMTIMTSARARVNEKIRPSTSPKVGMV